MTLSLPALHHVGIVVADIATASADFERRWGVTAGPATNLTFPGARHRGTTIDLSARYSFIDTGGSQIELIEPVSEPSPYTEFLAAGGGVHHLAYYVDRIDPYLDPLAEAGHDVSVLLDAALPGRARFVYLDGPYSGPAIELIEILSTAS
jgi:catechol 2,3-dioxygenase-like lactoylglutathione lyase family enzyme